MAWYDDVWDFAKENALELAKMGGAGAKAYIDIKDQKRRNELEEAAYRDYISNVEAAGKEAQAAIDLNLMPMEIKNVPTTKAEVSDFTAVAAKGGLMNLPTRQRKRYYAGTDEDEVMETEEEILTPDYLMKEEGVNIGPMAAFPDTGNPMSNAQQVWESGAIDQGIYQMDFNIFFQSGDWMDYIGKGEVQENMRVASAPGIEGLRHGGRPGYAEQGFVNPQQIYLLDPSKGYQPFMGEEEIIDNQPDTSDMGIGEIEIYMDEKVDQPKIVGSGMQGDGEGGTIKILLIETEMGGQVMISEEDYFKKYGIPKYKKGGRVKRDNGGIMNLGGLEKDYRTTGGFVPIGAYEKKDDVPARLSKNEFVMTADAVRAAGGGSINKGAQRMYDTMKHLEAQPQAKRMTV